jgi:Ca-activated chloride channel homolog
MRLADPQALLLLLLLPPFLWWLSHTRPPAGVGYPTVGPLAQMRPSWAARLRQALPWLRALVLILIVLALARPQWGVEATKLEREGIAIARWSTPRAAWAPWICGWGTHANRLEVVKATFRAS